MSSSLLVHATGLGASAAPAATVAGRLVDAAGAPIEGVEVVNQMNTDFMRTGTDGRFAVLPNAADGVSGIRASRRVWEERADDAAIGRSYLELRNVAVPPEGVDVGDVRMWRLSETRRIVVVDGEGDPMRSFAVRGTYCEQVERADLSPGYPNQPVEEQTCWGVDDQNIYKLYLMEIALPVGPDERAVLDATEVTLRDPATNTPYVESLSAARYDAATKTYLLTVDGIDTPPLEPMPSPRNVQVYSQQDGVRLSWENPTPGPNSPHPTSWTVRFSDRGQVVRTVEVRGLVWEPITGLPKGKVYDVTVIANHELGDSEPSQSVRFSTATPPVAPQDLAAKVKKRTAAFTWTPMTDDGGLPSTLTLQVKRDRYEVSLTASRFKVRKLKPGKYYVTLLAENAEGRTSSNPAKFKIRKRP